jgi:ASC-1-like (ASCH) protein
MKSFVEVQRDMRMIHQMGLYGEYIRVIREGKKKVEVRLNDEKRREIKVGNYQKITQFYCVIS